MALSITSRHSAALNILVGSIMSVMVMGIPHIDHHSRAPKDVHLAVETERPIQLHVSASGEMLRREGPSAKAARALTASPESPPVLQDGAVSVVSPAKSASEATKLEELTEECMHIDATADCMEKFGSYGVRNLYTESWQNIKNIGYLRSGWMSHPSVQKRHLFDLTLPGSANSASYAFGSCDSYRFPCLDLATTKDATTTDAAPYGAVAQNLDFYHQLRLGIRAFDIKVAYSTEEKLVYVSSHGTLMLPIATVLQDIRRFLEEHEREVVILDVRKDAEADVTNLQALNDEETANDRIPGEFVHEAVDCELREMVASYNALSQLPGDELAENPTIGALTDVHANVVYFYEGQQVLCRSLLECQNTLGWYPHDKSGASSYPAFAFGQPYTLGTRTNATGGKTTDRIVEPACQSHSNFYTKEDEPEKLLEKIKTYTKDIIAHTVSSYPKCYPSGTTLPELHKPTIWYTLDSYTTATAAEQLTQSDRMRGVKAIYTRGEGFTAKTDAERTNYLLLSWFLKQNNRAAFLKPNVILFEFVSSAMMPIIRIIEAEQNRPDCGWAIYCKDSGSCWADTRLGDNDLCIAENIVQQRLQDHANGKEYNSQWIIYTTIALCSLVLLFFILSAGGYFIKAFSPKNGLLEEEQNISSADSHPH